MRLSPLFALAALSLAVAAPAFANTVQFDTKLLASTEVPAKQSNGHGELHASFDTASKELSWKITYADLTGPATAAHFHGPALAGQNADHQVVIDKSMLASPIEGHATLSDAQAADLLAGKWYFNVHTAKNPGGEIRGQLEAAKSGY